MSYLHNTSSIIISYHVGPPKPCCFTNIIGKPIPVPKINNPTEEELVKYRDLYIEGISRLFETYKAEYGMKDVKLRIA